MSDALGEVRAFMEEAGDAALCEKLNTLENAYMRQPFRVCIVGGFSRGKTHLLNLLLGTELFPEDVVPATTVLTEARYGAEEAMRFVGVEKSMTFQPTAENLGKFCAGQEFSDASGVLTLELPLPLLYPDIIIYDTPGIDDIMEKRADIAYAALENCDAALVVTSALAPLGLNETQFIETYLHHRRIPKIAAVVSFMDQLTEAQRMQQLEYIENKMAQISPDIGIWLPCCDNLPKGNVVCGIEAMRNQLRQWATATDLHILRRKRAMQAAADVMKNYIDRQKALESDLLGDMAARERELERAALQLREESESWIDLRNEFMASGQRCAEELQKMAVKLTEEEVGKAGSEMESGNARIAMSVIAQKLAETAQAAIDRDKEKLLQGIRETFHISPNIEGNFQIYPDANKVLPQALDGEGILPDVGGILQFIENNIDKAVVFLPLPTPARWLAREVARRIIRIGREILSLPDNEADRKNRLEKFCAAIERDIRQATAKIYGAIAERVRENQLGWIEGRQRQLEIASGKAEAQQELAKCQSRIDEAERLLQNLQAEVQRDD